MLKDKHYNDSDYDQNAEDDGQQRDSCRPLGISQKLSQSTCKAVAERSRNEGRQDATTQCKQIETLEQREEACDAESGCHEKDNHGNDDAQNILESFHMKYLLIMSGFKLLTVLCCQKSSAGFGNLNGVVEHATESGIVLVHRSSFGRIAIGHKQLAMTTFIWVLRGML